MADIFLSHSSADNDAADTVRSWLARDRAGWSVFLDKHSREGILAGQDWQDRLRGELQSCRLVLAVITPTWLASRWCFTEAVTAAFRGKDFVGVVPTPLAEDAFEAAPPIVNERQRLAIDLVTGAGWPELLHALDRSGLDPSQWFSLPPGMRPYPGFVAFEERDAGVFFGRDREITRYLEELALLRAPDRAQALVISGGSGSGKSSLLKAGLIPRLRRQPDWHIVPPFDPSREPVHALLSAIRAAAQDARLELELPHDPPGTIESLTEWLQSSLRALEERTRRWVMLPLDQAEVLLAGSWASDDAGSSLLIDSIGALLASRARKLVAVLTIRTEFLPALERRIPPAVHLHDVSLRPLETLSEVIEKPAERFGIELETGLTGRMVEDTRGADALPLLAYTLHELHERFGADKLLTIEEYERSGGVEGAIERKLRDALCDPRPTPEELAAFRRCFVRQLVQIDEKAVEGERYLRKSIAADAVPAAATRVVERLQQARLLVGQEDGSVGIAHERLIRDWPELPFKTWLMADGNDRQLIDGLKSMLATHEAGGPLLTAKPLVDAQDFLAREPTFAEEAPTLGEFVERSIAAERLRVRRRRWTLHGAIAASIVFFGVATGAILFYLEAEEQTDLAITQTAVARAERENAERQRDEAEKQKRLAEAQRDAALLAEARRLAAQADRSLASGNIKKALATALDAVTGSGGAAPPYRSDNVQTLLRAMEAHRDVLFTFREGVEMEPYLAGETLFLLNGAGAVAVNLRTGEVTRRRPEHPGRGASIGRSGTFVAFNGEGGTTLARFDSEREPVRLHTGEGRPFTMDSAFGPEDAFVAVLTRFDGLYLFELDPESVPRLVGRAVLFERPVSAREIRISRDGAHVAVLSHEGAVRHLRLHREDDGSLRIGTISEPIAWRDELIEVDERTWIKVSGHDLEFLHRENVGDGPVQRIFALTELEQTADGEPFPAALRTPAAAPGDDAGRDAEPRGSPRLLPYTRRDRRYLSKLDANTVGVFRLLGDDRGVLEQVLHHPGVRTANFDLEGERVISTGRDETTVWNVATPRRRSRDLPLQDTSQRCGSRVHDVHCDARRLLVLSGGDYRRSAPTDYCIWDAELPDPTPIGGDTSYSSSARFRSDARLVEVDLLGDSRFVDARTGRSVEEPGVEPTEGTASSGSPDEQSAVAPDGAEVSYVDGELVFTDRQGETVAARLVEAPVGPLAFSPNGTLVATGHDSRTRVWRTASGELVDYLDHETSSLACATFAGEDTLVTVDTGGRIDRWRVGDFRVLEDMVGFARSRILGE